MMSVSALHLHLLLYLYPAIHQQEGPAQGFSLLKGSFSWGGAGQTLGFLKTLETRLIEVN